MREFRFRQLEQYQVGGTQDHMELALPAPMSPSGKIYQYSPNPHASPRLFLLGDAPAERNIVNAHRSRIRREPGPGHTVCPYSGYIGEDEEFTHVDDIDAVKKHLEWILENDISNWLGELANDFNRRQPRGDFLSITMEHEPLRRPKPLAIREDLLRSLSCFVCSREYGVYALALFCPDCGSPNVALHFRREIELVVEQITLADKQSEKGNVELAYRLMGNAHEDVLTAFEATLKAVYTHLVRTHFPELTEKLAGKKTIGNSFQNIERGRKLFSKLDLDPFEELNDDEINHIRLNIEKRHVLGHNLGVADDHYASFTEELEIGQTVTLIGKDIRLFGALCLEIIETLEKSLLPNDSNPT